MELIINPKFRELLPDLTAEEKATLEQSIKDEGCRDALIVWRGQIVDGHNRYEICTRLGLPFAITEKDFADEEAAMDWIDCNQLGRRNLTHDAYMLALGRRYNRSKQAHGGQLPKGMDQNDPSLSTSEKLAQEYGVSPATVKRAGRFADEVNNKPTWQDAIRNNIPIKKIKNDAKKQKAQDKSDRKAERPLLDDSIRLICGSLAESGDQVQSNSVDYIITDPPYPKEYLYVYSDLSVFASRVLKPGGSLICMVGQSYLPDVMSRLSDHLTYQWVLSYIMSSGTSPQIWQRKVNTFWKPLLWYVKGEYSGDWIGDVCKVPPKDRDKSFHEWGQSENGMIDILERFTYPGQLICDPFVGGGTTAIACKRLARNFIGIDIDPEAIKTTYERMLNEQSS